MPSKLGGVAGRPTIREVERQRREFRALVAAGVPLDEAVRRAAIKPERAIEELTPLVQQLLERAA